MSDSVVLGKYQMEWLNDYHKIDLTQWRRIYCDDPNIMWEIGNLEKYQKKQSFLDREANIRSNPYYYWPNEYSRQHPVSS